LLPSGLHEFLLRAFFAGLGEHAAGPVVFALNGSLVAEEEAHLGRFRRIAEEIGERSVSVQVEAPFKVRVGCGC
jgi:hypothetical protein